MIGEDGVRYRCEPAADGDDEKLPVTVRLATQGELAQNQEAIESPYDVEARYRNKSGLGGMGYAVHLSETGDEQRVNLLTHVKTTPANVAEAKCLGAIQQALVKSDRAPKTHLADAGYIAADRLVQSETQHGITLVGPVRESARWQDRVEGA